MSSLLPLAKHRVLLHHPLFAKDVMEMSPQGTQKGWGALSSAATWEDRDRYIKLIHPQVYTPNFTDYQCYVLKTVILKKIHQPNQTCIYAQWKKDTDAAFSSYPMRCSLSVLSLTWHPWEQGWDMVGLRHWQSAKTSGLLGQKDAGLMVPGNFCTGPMIVPQTRDSGWWEFWEL